MEATAVKPPIPSVSRRQGQHSEVSKLDRNVAIGQVASAVVAGGVVGALAGLPGSLIGMALGSIVGVQLASKDR
jgi:hypothetical protein